MVQQVQACSPPEDSPPSMSGLTRIAVDVTFLRMTARPDHPAPALPPGYDIVHVPAPTVGFYRYLYGMVGHAHCWWLRRVAGHGEIAAVLADPRTSLHVLYGGGEPGGFFELDGRHGADVNISYFGLMPHLIGHRLGSAFLRAAVDEAWRQVEARAGSQAGSGAGFQAGSGVRVNTCTADHPRALDGYLRVGFKPLRSVREIWAIPDRLGMPIPQHLRA